MKFADEIMNNKKARIEQKLKDHNTLVNTELLEIEKAINTYEKNDEDTKTYIDIPMIIKTEEAKESLKEHRFYIDKTNQNIPYGTTRVYLDETSYNIATRRERKPINIAEDLHKEENIKDKTCNKEHKENAKTESPAYKDLLDLLSDIRKGRVIRW